MIKATGKNKFLPAVAFLMALLSCDSGLIYTDAKTIPGTGWDLSDKAEFMFQVADTSKSTNIFLTLRTGSKYPYRNIFLFVTTKAPDGKSITDTLEYQLADEKGRWLGKGFGDIHELKFSYKRNVFFPRQGIYIFNIQHGMRDPVLKGVYDIGVRIEKFAQ